MNLNKTLALLLLCSLMAAPIAITLVAPSQALAQTGEFEESDEEVDTSALRKLAHLGNIEDAKSLGAPFLPQNLAEYWNDSTADFGPFTYDGNMWINEGVDDANEWSAERKHSINAQGPLSGMMTGFNAGAIVDLYTENLAGPVPMLFATINLTEPGIGFGLANAAQNVAQLLTHQYQFDQQLHNRAMANPETGEIVYKNFISCVSKKLEGEATSVWEAQTMCTPGEVVKPAGSTDIFPAPDSTEGFKWTDDPNGANASGETILLTNLLFDQEKDGGSGAYPVDLESISTSFKELIGDIEFTYEPIASDEGKSFAKTISVKRIKPEKLPPVMYRDIVKQRYDELKTILKNRCEYENGNSTGGEDDDGDFYAIDEEARKMLVRLSAKGARIKPSAVESLFWMFLKEEVARKIDESGKYEAPCDAIEAGGYDGSDFSLAVDGDIKKVSRRMQIMFSLAQRIGFAQYMETLGKAEEVVKKLTAGTSDTSVRRYALELVYAAAGTSNIREAIQRSNELFKQQMTVLYTEYQADQNQSGSKLAPMFAESGGGSNVDSAVDLESEDEGA